jgi:hypothetical protein
MTDMQTSLPLLIVRPSILNPVMHFSTQPLIDEMKCPMVIPLPCAFHFISFDVDATHAPTNHKWYDPLHIITWPYWFIDLDFTCSSPLLWSIGAKSSLNLPFTVVTSSSSQVCLDLLHLSHMTSCHVSYAMSSFITCVSRATYLSHFTSMA